MEKSLTAAMNKERNSVVLFALSEQEQAMYSSFFDIFNMFFDDELNGTLSPNDASTEFLSQSILAVVVSDLRQEEIKTIQHWMSDAYLCDTPILQHHFTLPSQLLTISNRMRQAACLYIDTSLQLAELRQLHEELHNTYAELRNHLYEASLIAPRIIFLNPTDPDAQVAVAGAKVIEQRLPIDIQSCCGISLYLDENISDLSEGNLMVEILSPDDGTISVSWNIRYSDLKIGWVTFAFERSESFTKKSAVLRLKYNTLFGEEPRFSFGYNQAREDRATLIDGVRIQRSIALKVWTSVRGARLTTTTQMWPAFFPDYKNVFRIELSVDESLELFHVTDDAKAPYPFPLVVRDLAKRRILVHPLGAEPTIAKISSVCPPGTWEIRAEVLTDHDMASPVEYALLAIRPSQSVEFRFYEVLDADWHLAMPSISSIVIHRLHQPADLPLDLLLLTRMPEGSISDYCWAHFQSISFLGKF